MAAPLWRVVGARLRALQPVTIAHVVVPTVLALLGVVAGLHLELSPWEAVYSVVQSFSLGMDVLPPAAAVLAHPVWNTVAWTVRFALPIATGAALLEGLRIMRQIRHPLVWMRGHAVVVGAGPLGVALARHLVRSRPVVLVDADRRPAAVGILEREGVRVVWGDPRSPDVLRRCNVGFATAVVATGRDDLLNVEVAQVALHLGGPRCVVHVADRPLRGSLSQLFRATELITFDVNEFAATRLVLDAFDPQAAPATVVIVGLGRFGEAVLRSVVAAGRASRIVVVDADAGRAPAIRRMVPGVEVGWATPAELDHDPGGWFKALPGPFTVVLCSENDVRNLDLAVRLSRLPDVRVELRALSGPAGWQDPAALAERLPGVRVRALAELAVEQIEALGV